jgi:ACR3 family arsenite transporter
MEKQGMKRRDNPRSPIVAGIGLGTLLPDLFQALAGFEYGSVNFVVAILIWLMVYPMMVSVDFSSLKHIHERPKGLIITLASSHA